MVFESCDHGYFPIGGEIPNWMRLKKGKLSDPSHYHGFVGTLLYLIASRDLTYNLLYDMYADHAGCQDTRRAHLAV
ncbi:hypothetical protein Tco_0641802 [Tanacetum coccineum]